MIWYSIQYRNMDILMIYSQAQMIGIKTENITFPILSVYIHPYNGGNS